MKRVCAALLALFLGTSTIACTQDDTASDRERILDKGTLVVGITDFEPLDYQDESGEWVGFDAELARAFGASLDVDVTLQEINWATKENELNGLTIDIIWNGMTWDEERAENMTLSEPYLVNEQVIVTNDANSAAWATLSDIGDASIAIESGSMGEKALDDQLDSVTKVEKGTQVEALTELAMGTVDAVVIDAVMANYLTNKEDSQFNGLIVRNDLIEAPDDEYVVALRKGSDLIDELNAFLDESRENGLMNELGKKYGLTNALK